MILQILTVFKFTCLSPECLETDYVHYIHFRKSINRFKTQSVRQVKRCHSTRRIESVLLEQALVGCQRYTTLQKKPEMTWKSFVLRSKADGEDSGTIHGGLVKFSKNDMLIFFNILVFSFVDVIVKTFSR